MITKDSNIYIFLWHGIFNCETRFKAACNGLDIPILYITLQLHQ